MANKKYIQIEIDGLTADLPAEAPNIQITYVNPCAGGFGTISGNKSERSLSLPATKQNDEIFQSWWKVNQANTPAAAEEKNASIKVNGLSVIDGKAQLKNVSTVGRFYERGGKDYSVSFFGANADWFEQLNDLELGRDLDWSAESHNYDNANITAGFNASPSNVYAYGVIKLEDWAYENAGITYVDLYQCTPLLFIGEIVKKAFNSIGYTLSTSFFQNAVNERYVLPVPLPKKYPQEFSEDYLNIKATKTVTQSLTGALVNITGVTFSNQTVFPNVGPNPYVGSTATTVVIGAGLTSQYTAPDAGFYQVRASVLLNNISGVGTFGFLPLGLGFGATVPDADYAISPANNGDTFFIETVARLEQGGVMEFYLGGSAGLSLDIEGGTLEIIGEAEIGPGTLIDFKYLLRDWKVTDFIKGLTAAFNLCWETNVNLKTVLVEPKDDYLVTNRSTGLPSILPGFHTSTTTDSTPKLDFNKNGRVTAVNNIAETQQYQWKQDSSDKTAEAANELEDIPFDAAKYVMPLNRFKPDTEENENPFFAPTIMLFDEEIREETSLYTPCIPLMWPENYREVVRDVENETEFTPRILWFGGQRPGVGSDGLDGIIETVDTLTKLTTKRFLPALFFVNYNDPTGLDVSLNWSTLTVNGNTVQGHLQKFYLRESRRQREGKEVEEHIYWDELDILNLSFRPKILINNGLYIMKEINSYSPIIDRSTKTILVYDLPAAQEDVNRIDNTLAVGFIGQYSDPDD